eukprot:Lankesteria_metandrocarpae@DN7441_c0_g1_i1.p1
MSTAIEYVAVLSDNAVYSVFKVQWALDEPHGRMTVEMKTQVELGVQLNSNVSFACGACPLVWLRQPHSTQFAKDSSAVPSACCSKIVQNTSTCRSAAVLCNACSTNIMSEPAFVVPLINRAEDGTLSMLHVCLEALSGCCTVLKSCGGLYSDNFLSHTGVTLLSDRQHNVYGYLFGNRDSVECRSLLDERTNLL